MNVRVPRVCSAPVRMALIATPVTVMLAMKEHTVKLVSETDHDRRWGTQKNFAKYVDV